MFSAASKTCFTLAVASVVAGFGYVAATGDRSGFTLLVFLGVLAGVLGALLFFALGPDTAPDAAASPAEAPAARRQVDTTDVPRASIWPLAGAAALGVLAAGATLDVLIGIGVILGIIVTFAWLAQVWREHPSWTREMTDRLNDRFVLPVGLPGTVITLVGIGVISFSRLLLAVNKDIAAVLALAAALAILFGCAFVASRERMGRAALTGLSTFAVVMVVAAGIAGAVKGERQFGEHGGGEGEGKDFKIVAKDIAFDLDELDLPAETAVKLQFENKDEGVPHNVGIYVDKGGKEIFKGETITGPKTAEYKFDSPDSGTFYFQCDIHPNMNGKLVVSRDASQPEEKSGQAPDSATSNRKDKSSEQGK